MRVNLLTLTLTVSTTLLLGSTTSRAQDNPIASLQKATDPFASVKQLQTALGSEFAPVVGPLSDVAHYYAITVGSPASLPTAPRIGEEKVVTAIVASCNANWSGFCNKDRCSDNPVFTAPKGWVLMNFTYAERTNNNGSASVSQIAGGTDLVLEKSIDEAYDGEIQAAIRNGDKDREAKARNLRELHKKAVNSVRTNMGTIAASISAEAHGVCPGNAKGGSIGIEVYATLVYLGDETDIQRAVHDVLR